MFGWFKKSSKTSDPARKREPGLETPAAFHRARLPPRRSAPSATRERLADRAIAYLKPALKKGPPPSTLPALAVSPIVRPLNDDLCICYLVDEGESYQYVQQRHLTHEGVSKEQLHQIGLRNLADVAAKRDLRIQPYENIYAVMMGGDFEASLILLDQLWGHQFRQFVSGDYAIAIPTRDVMAFCDSTSAAGVAELQELIGRVYATGDHPISNKIFIRRNGRFIPRTG